ncbi:MAG: tetratricopeptide repeat protein, partial [Pseudomonadota bacterium]
AGAAFADAIRLDPGSARAHLGAAAVKMADGSYDDALELCDKVLDLDPTMERAQELIAQINYKRGDTEAALAELRRLIESSPQNRRALYAFIGLMRSEGRGDEMLATLEADAQANPGDLDRENRFTLVAARSGKPEMAVNYFRKLVEENGSSKAADTMRYAMALIAAGETEKASAVIRPLEKRRATRPIAMKLDGDIALKSGDFEKSIDQYRSACVNARCPLLDAEAEEGAPDAEARAGLWRAHTTSALAAAVKTLRENLSAGAA